MSPDENRLLTNFLNQLSQVSGVTKDPQAAALIADAVARQPDAAYLLVQRALLQDQALNTARERIASLEAQIKTTMSSTVASPGSFLDSGSNAWGRSSGNTPIQQTAPVLTQYAAPQPVAHSPGFFGGGGGSFLTSMAATAAGVAGGAFLFQGIESMMHHGGSSHLMNQQGNSFGDMANSVDRTPSSAPVAAPVDTATDSQPVAADDSALPDVASDDSGSGGDDSYA